LEKGTGRERGEGKEIEDKRVGGLELERTAKGEGVCRGRGGGETGGGGWEKIGEGEKKCGRESVGGGSKRKRGKRREEGWRGV